MRLWQLAVLVLLTIPAAFHVAFHLSDWAVWGLHLADTVVRSSLLPMFDASPTGLLGHPAVAIAGVFALAWLWLIHFRPTPPGALK